MDPPPCLTVCLSLWVCRLSPSRTQHQERPSVQNRFILVSSDQMTCFQSATVQSLWRLAKSSLALIFLDERSGLHSFSAASMPASCRVLRTVRSLTSILRSSLSLFCTTTAVSSLPEVIALTQNRLS